MGFLRKLFGQPDPHEEIHDIYRKVQARAQEIVEVTLSVDDCFAVTVLSRQMIEDGIAEEAMQKPGTTAHLLWNAIQVLTLELPKSGEDVCVSLCGIQWVHLGITAKHPATHLKEIQGPTAEQIELARLLLGLERSIGNALRAHNQALGRGGGS